MFQIWWWLIIPSEFPQFPPCFALCLESMFLIHTHIPLPSEGWPGLRQSFLQIKSTQAFVLQHPLKCCVSLTSSSFLKKSGLDLAEHGFLPAKQKRLLLVPSIGRLVLDFGTPLYNTLTSFATSTFSSFQKIIISLLGSKWHHSNIHLRPWCYSACIFFFLFLSGLSWTAEKDA